VRPPGPQRPQTEPLITACSDVGAPGQRPVEEDELRDAQLPHDEEEAVAEGGARERVRRLRLDEAEEARVGL